MTYARIILSPGSDLPVQTAARELAAGTGAGIVKRPHNGKITSGEIVLALGRDAESYPLARRMLGGISSDRK